MKKLGKTIGIYGDSYGVRPYKNLYAIKHNLQNLLTQTPHNILDVEDGVGKLRYNYLRDPKEFAVPSDSLINNTSWWIYQISKMFNKPIHYGYSGSSIEHMLFSQIDVNNNFEKLFPNKPLAKNIVPDVMICLWTDPWRYYFDHVNKFFTKDLGFTNQDLQHLNQLGSPTIFARAGIKNENFKNYKYRSFAKKVRNSIEITSPYIVYQRKLSYKLMFDQVWSLRLKEKNPKCKIIHIDCMDDFSHLFYENKFDNIDRHECDYNREDIIFTKNNLPFKNNVWINNFAMEELHGDGIEEPDSPGYHWDNYIGHFTNQQQHNFFANKLVEWIQNYDDLVGNFDFSDWKSQYDML